MTFDATFIDVSGYAAASLLAILFAIPFGLRVVSRREAGQWSSLPQAFYHAHLELFLGNACLGKFFLHFEKIEARISDFNFTSHIFLNKSKSSFQCICHVKLV